MASSVDVVLGRVNENLEYSFQKDHVDNFFSKDVDAFFAHLQEDKESDNGGRGYVWQVKTRGAINANPTYNLAGNGGPGRHEFTFRPVNIEWRASWTRDEMLAAASQGATNAFDLAEERIKQEMHFAKIALGIQCGGGAGWGTLAGIVAVTTGASGTVTIGHPDGDAAGATVKELMNRFFVGQTIVVADAEGSGNLRGSSPGDSAVITARNLSTGVLTFDTVPATWTDGDFMFEKGYRNYSASDGALMVAGLEGWLPPAAAASGVLFGGKDRFLYEGLEPLRFDTSTVGASTIKTKLIHMDEFAYTHGLRGNSEDIRIFISARNFRELVVDAEQQVQLKEVKRKASDGTTYGIGYSAFHLIGHKGITEVVPSAFVRPGLAFWGPFGSKEMGFRLKYSGDMMMNITKNNGQVFYLDPRGVTDNLTNTAAGYRAEGFYRGNMGCKHPGNYLVGTSLTDDAV